MLDSISADIKLVAAIQSLSTITNDNTITWLQK